LARNSHRPRRWLAAFWHRAYSENVTGLSAMVAYNLMLAVFPFTLLVLFIGGQVLKIHGVETSVLNDLQRLFPNTESQTLSDVLDKIENNSATIGIAAFVGSIWIGASFWGAMDTAFCRIYHVPCRGWIEQKRFSFAMLGVVLLFIAASIFVPTLESSLVSSTDKLPFGLSAGLANWLFPLYLTNVSSLSRLGSTLGFVLIALLWFYILSLAIMAGAVINSLRFEYLETGELPYVAGGGAPPTNPCAGPRDDILARAKAKKQAEKARAKAEREKEKADREKAG
jgi:membrane protein